MAKNTKRRKTRRFRRKRGGFRKKSRRSSKSHRRRTKRRRQRGGSDWRPHASRRRSSERRVALGSLEEKDESPAPMQAAAPPPPRPAWAGSCSTRATRAAAAAARVNDMERQMINMYEKRIDAQRNRHRQAACLPAFASAAAPPPPPPNTHSPAPPPGAPLFPFSPRARRHLSHACREPKSTHTPPRALPPVAGRPFPFRAKPPPLSPSYNEYFKKRRELKSKSPPTSSLTLKGDGPMPWVTKTATPKTYYAKMPGFRLAQPSRPDRPARNPRRATGNEFEKLLRGDRRPDCPPRRPPSGAATAKWSPARWEVKIKRRRKQKEMKRKNKSEN